MISLSATELLEQQLARSMGMDRYAELLNAVKMTDVSVNLEFQRSFNGFYRVRRNKELLYTKVSLSSAFQHVHPIQ